MRIRLVAAVLGTIKMPNRCCFVPNCKAGYLGFKPCGKVVLFAPPKDEALFKQWEQNIPRNDANLKASSRVTSKKLSLSKAGCLKGRREKKFSLLGTIGVLNKEPPQEFFQGFIFLFQI
uniref:THAP-type domain-containing protein n=1 Tax=Daphnia galeata TaxID=27404 RepID=A0A8J2RKQ3_9CRUS|nr:unnamed protein product [Daphnia galeata]CAH0111402.1 unnamed protein product [Daphnia galeata]